jgi:cytochrome P450
MGWGGWLPALLQPGKQHTESRRLFQKGLSPRAVATYKNLIDTSNKELLKWALDYSGDPERIASKYVGVSV